MATHWVRAPLSGVVSKPAALGQNIRAGQRLVTIGDPFGEAEEQVRADVHGHIYRFQGGFFGVESSQPPPSDAT